MMNKLDWNTINELVAQRYLRIEKHPDAELYICNYTAKAQYEAYWNKYTSIFRGLIVDQAGVVVARPFAKFFNLGEVKLHELPDEPFEVYEKLDGSLGIMYWLDGKPYIATRGSFVSEQAQMANAILQEKYHHHLSKLDPAYTYLFEVIYPTNRIVVDYGAIEDMFLLAIIDTKTGQEVPLNDIGFPVVAKHSGVSKLTELQKYATDNKEGFVIRYASGLRVKVKFFAEYVRLHQIITGLSLLDICAYLSEGKSMDDLLEQVPDEVYDWVKESVVALQCHYDTIESACKEVYQEFPTRKETALYFQKQAYPRVLFAMLTGKDYGLAMDLQQNSEQ